MHIINAFLKSNSTATFTANKRLIIMTNISHGSINSNCTTSICLNRRYLVCHCTSRKLPTVICSNMCTSR